MKINHKAFKDLDIYSLNCCIIKTLPLLVLFLAKDKVHIIDSKHGIVKYIGKLDEMDVGLVCS